MESLARAFAQPGLEKEFREVLRIVMHDLRSPLANARGLLAELRQDAGRIQSLIADERGEAGKKEELSRVVAEDLPETIRYLDQCVSRMDGVINCISSYARAGLSTFEPEVVDLRELVDELLQARRAELESHGCEVEVGPFPHVFADRAAAQQVVDELLANAIAALSSERAGRISIAGEADGGVVRVTLADNGIGVADKDLERIFMPLRQGGNAVRSGRGMGLAVARSLVQRHGGTLRCSSVPDEGTEFTFTLPQATPARD